MQNNNPLISIIVPVYNVLPYVSKCIESILAQTYSNLEIILVDDGATDGSGSILDNYANSDSRIVVIHKENGGQGSARNRGLDVCHGEYVYFIDSDDVMFPECIEKLFEVMLDTVCDVSVCNFHYISTDGSIIGIGKHNNRVKLTSSICTLDGKTATGTMLYQTTFDVQVWAKLYKVQLWENIRFDENPVRMRYEDLATLYRVMLKAQSVVYKDIPLMGYLVREDSAVHKPFEKNQMGMLDVLEEIREYMNINAPSVTKAVNCRMVAVAFVLALTMKREKEYSTQDYERCVRIIKQFRTSVLLDKKARKKTRIAALFSFLGMNCVYKIYNNRKRKNPTF